MSARKALTTRLSPSGKRFDETAGPGEAALALVDWGLLGVIFVAPLFMGGRSPLGALVYVVLVCLITISWCAYQALQPTKNRPRWRRTSVDLLLLAGLCLIVAQIVPLPVDLSAWLSPGAAELLPMWFPTEGQAAAGGGAQLGQWSTLSLTPAATRQGIAVYLAHAMLFVVLVQRISCREDVERMLRLLAIGCVAMAVVGLAQFLFGNGKFLWVYEHPFRDTTSAVRGPFINQNHFAHMLALGIAPIIWWMQRRLDEPAEQSAPDTAGRGRKGPSQKASPKQGKRPARGPRRAAAWGYRANGQEQAFKLGLLIALGVVAMAGMLTFSRGGVIVILAAATTAIGLFFWKGLLGRQYLAGLAGVGLFVAAGLAIFGYESLSTEMSTIASGDLDEIDSGTTRRELWAGSIAGAAEFPLFGTGVGSHVEYYPIHFEDYRSVEYTHAESGYFHLLLETGVGGLLLALSGIAAVAYWCVSGLRKAEDKRLAACAVVITAALVTSMLHSVWDFVWLIPTCMSWSVLLAACGCRISQLARQAEAPQSELQKQPSHQPRIGAPRAQRAIRWTWWGATAVTAGVAVVMIGVCRGPARAAGQWDRYLLEMHASTAEEGAEPVEPSLGHQLTRLDAILLRNPNDARAHLAMAAGCLELFAHLQQDSDNRLGLTQIRAAALASHFPDREALDVWLERAIGDNRRLLDRASYHALRAAELCPLQGEAYLYLADLAFLNGGDAATSDELLQQALLVRPNRGAVHFAVGSHAAMAGDVPRMLEHWKQAFHQDPRFKTKIITQVAPLLGAEAFLREFAPEYSGTRKLYALYRNLSREQDARVAAAAYIEHLEQRAQTQPRERAARYWQEAAKVYDFLGQPTNVLLALRNAMNLTPDDYNLRRQIAKVLIAQEKYEEALVELEWCRARKPKDSRTRNMALRARRLSLAARPPTGSDQSEQQRR